MKSRTAKRRYLRPEAAKYIEDQTQAKMSPRTLESRPVPFAVINGRASYAEKDLDAYVAQVLAAAGRRMNIRRGSRPLGKQRAPETGSSAASTSAETAT